MDQDLYQFIHTRFGQLKQDRSSWEDEWRDIRDMCLPRHGRFDNRRENDGKREDDRIEDDAPQQAVKLCAAGLQSGLTSPASRWFSLGIRNQDLTESSQGKRWLQQAVERPLYDQMSHSNMYHGFHQLYMEMSALGTAAMLILEDDRDVFRARNLTIGEYYLACDNTQRVISLYRKFKMTVAQMYSEYGYDNLPAEVKRRWDANERMQQFDILQAFEPDYMVADHLSDPMGRPYCVVDLMMGGSHRKPLRYGWFYTKPFVAGRWELVGNNVYGEGPGHQQRGNMMRLQTLEEDFLIGLSKVVDPPIVGGPDTVGTEIDKEAGGITHVAPTVQGGNLYRPLYLVNPALQDLQFKIQDVQSRIQKGFFNDLFFAITMANRRNMTATEVDERRDEKLLALGPVIELMRDDVLDPALDRMLDIMFRRGLIPPAPPELQGQEITFVYTSFLAMAQRAIGLGNIHQFAGFIGNLISVRPDLTDKVDWEQMVDIYGDRAGVPADIIRSDDEVAGIRYQRAQQQMEMQQAEREAQAAKNAKTLSEADLTSNNALTAILNGAA